jgi:hypothetical protein
VEIVCHRCHRAVPSDSSFCPSCGLPQLVYDAVEAPGQLPDDSCSAGMPDAGTVDWKHALRVSALLAVPTGIISNMLGLFGAFLIAFAAILVVLRYMRNRQPAWITVGAGARIGLVTGLLCGWSLLAVKGLDLFANRFWLHQGKVLDDQWVAQADQQATMMISLGYDVQRIAAQHASMLTPDGQAGWMVAIQLVFAAVLLPFAVAGGAIGARLVVRVRRSSL